MPFTTECQFSSDPTQPKGKQIWYVTDGPAFEGIQIFGNATFESGWVTGGPPRNRRARRRDYNGLWSGMVPIGRHICGNPEWFASGVPPGTPTIERGPDGWPVCCPHAIPMLSALAMWPSSTVSVGPVDTPSGGIRIGGLVADRLVRADAPAGGIRIGGQIADRRQFTDAPTGGTRIGGFVLDTLARTDSPTGGVKVGGSVGDYQLANLLSSNESGVAGSFAVNQTLIGGTGVLLIPGSNQITITAVPALGPTIGSQTFSGAPTATTVVLSWALAVNATQVFIFRSTSSTMSSPTLVYSGSGTTYTDTGLTTGDTYYYQLVPANATGFGSPSAVQQYTTTNVPTVQGKQSTTGALSGTGTFTVNLPSTVQPGDLLVLVFATSYVLASAPTISGWTQYVTEGGISNGHIYAYYTTYASSMGSTVAVGLAPSSSTNLAATVYDIIGQSGAPEASSVGQANSTSVAVASLTPTGSNDLLIGGCAWTQTSNFGVGTLNSAPSGMTDHGSYSVGTYSYQLVVFDAAHQALTSSSPTGTRTWVCNNPGGGSVSGYGLLLAVP
jgi:hypothetical protein